MAGAFQIGDFTIAPDLNRIEDARRPGTSIQIEPKVMDVLVCLQGAAGEVVLREQILAQVWGGTIVGPDVLTRAIGQLRKALGDDPQNPRCIETIPRRGYRLLVDSGLEESRSGTGPAPSVPEPPRRQLAWPHYLILFVLVGVLLVAALQDRFAVADRVVRPTRVYPVTSSAGKEVGPAVNPDGTQVAFARQAEGGGPLNIHVQDLASGRSRQLTFVEFGAQHPAWSPDGQTIAFIGEGDDRGVHLVSASGGIPRRITDYGHPDEHKLAWTADGQSLIMPRQDQAGAPAGLVLVDLASGRTRELTRPDANHAGDFEPAVSPDGRRVAFVRVRTSGAQDIHLVPLAGGDVRRLTHDSQMLTGLDWSQDGRHIIYSSLRAGVYALWRIAADGGLPQLVLGGGDKIKNPATARAADLVTFENWLYETNIWRQPLPAGADGDAPRPELMVRSTQWDLQPAYAPDGRTLAFVSTRSGSSELWLADADGANPHRRTDFLDARVGSPRWSPDGSRLAFTIMTNGQTDIFVMPVDGGSGYRLTEHPLDELAPAWSRDGQSVYFASRRSDTWQVWQVSLTDGALTQVTRDGGFAAAESADGRILYFNRTDAVGLWEMPLSGGPTRRIVEEVRPQDWGNWAVTDSGICFVDRSGERLGFARWDRESNRIFRVADVDSLVGQGLSISPDGRWLAYSRVDRAECDILAAEALR